MNDLEWLLDDPTRLNWFFFLPDHSWMFVAARLSKEPIFEIVVCGWLKHEWCGNGGFDNSWKKGPTLFTKCINWHTCTAVSTLCVFSVFKPLKTCFQLSSSQALPPSLAPYLAHRCNIHTPNMPTMWKIASDVIFLFLRLRFCIAVEAPCTLMATAQHCSLSVEAVVPNGAPGLIKMYGLGPAQHARLRWSLNLLNHFLCSPWCVSHTITAQL